MNYSLENKRIKLNKVNIIGSGVNGNVYRYKNLAIKIFTNGEITEGLIDSKTCRDLCNISTDSILLPKNLVFYKEKIFSGYTLQLVNTIRTHSIVKWDKKCFIDSIESLEEDVLRLSNKGVLLDGILPENVIISDRLYLIDPSKYSFVDKQYCHGLYDLNNYQIHLLLSKLVLISLKKNDITSAKLQKLKKVLLSKESDRLSSKFFDELIGKEKNIYSYVKKMK